MTATTNRHVDVMVAHFLRGDGLSAYRYYTENRVSFGYFNQARTRAAAIKRHGARGVELIEQIRHQCPVDTDVED